MSTVIVSPKFQIIIPKEIRRKLKIRSGQKLQMIEFENRIELIPLRSVKSMKGFLSGLETEFDREGDRL
ncbi:AbrB/MazE/SpoVT family DNA-binding domain-containing protein [bacterium]|nr:AbrB/MazE/SpoVT family DNA-binding domain-containing protein [bacterium]